MHMSLSTVATDLAVPSEVDCPWFVESWLEEHPDFPLADGTGCPSITTKTKCVDNDCDSLSGYFLG